MLTRFRINKVDKPDYYEWDYDGVLALAGRRKTPPGVIVTTDCRTVDPRRLPEEAFGRTGANGGSTPVLGEVPEALRPEIERLAREWAGDRPRGWPQVEAVLTKLRTEYAHDRDAVSGHPRAAEAGGLSGRPVFEKSTATLRAFASHLGSRIPIIGVGGISSLEDARQKIRAGATLVQIYTSFIYQGPKLVRELARGL